MRNFFSNLLQNTEVIFWKAIDFRVEFHPNNKKDALL
jgi:hypothetical protein